MGILAAFDPLRIKPGFTLGAYQFCSDGNGNGFVWAIPSGAPLPAPDDCPRIEGAFLSPPKPADALDDYMHAIEGDGSPLAYLSASVLARELSEFGARWHGVSWGMAKIIGRKPPNSPDRIGSRVAKRGARASRWTWLEPVPKQWRPQTTQTDDGVEVRFYLFDIVGSERVIQVTDSFRPGSYAFSSESSDVAVGGSGIIF